METVPRRTISSRRIARKLTASSNLSWTEQCIFECDMLSCEAITSPYFGRFWIVTIIGYPPKSISRLHLIPNDIRRRGLLEAWAAINISEAGYRLADLQRHRSVKLPLSRQARFIWHPAGNQKRRVVFAICCATLDISKGLRRSTVIDVCCKSPVLDIDYRWFRVMCVMVSMV